MTLHIVGLGPGDEGLMTLEAHRLLGSGIPVLLRTRHHPTVATIDPDQRFDDCDDLYAGGLSFDEVYERIVARVVERALAGDLVFATPGNPLVAESAVEAAIAAAEAEGIDVRIVTGVSYVDVAASVLRCDLGNVQLCDALALRIDAQRPALISQLYDRDSVSQLKLQLLDIYPADHSVTVLRSLGTGQETAIEVSLADLDHQAYSYLDTLFVPAIAPVEDVRRFDGLWHVIERLHAPDGCPWDREQTHESLRHHLLEESYEALDAIDSGDPAKISEEMGDVLLQVLMHAAVGERESTFGLPDVVEHISRKLIRRHPHVFGETTAASADEVYQNWEALKQKERPEGSILDGVPVALPALAASQSIQGRARRVGFDWPNIEGPLEKLREELEEFARADAASDREEEFGDVLFVIANIAQRLDIDAEQALRGANAKFRQRFGKVEELARERGLDMKAMDLQALDALWDEAKEALAG